MQLWHGSVDTTLSPKNYDDTLKQWTNVFGVIIVPIKSQKDTPLKNLRTDALA
jgi:acetylxylan esterase